MTENRVRFELRGKKTRPKLELIVITLPFSCAQKILPGQAGQSDEEKGRTNVWKRMKKIEKVKSKKITRKNPGKENTRVLMGFGQWKMNKKV